MTATSDANTAPVELARAPLWSSAVTIVAIAFTLRTAWDLQAIRPDYARVVTRGGIPPIYTLVILAASLITFFNSYVAAASLWFRRRWAPRAIVGYGIVVTVTRIGVRTYFTRDRGQLFSGDEWAAIASLVIILAVTAVIVERALSVLPTKPAPLDVPPVPRWEFWLTLAAAIPPTLFAVRMLALGGGASSDDQTEGGNLAKLAWISLPIVLLLIKRLVDSTFTLRPEGPPRMAATNTYQAVPHTTMYVTPQAFGEFACSEVETRVLQAPDGVLRRLWLKGHAPSNSAPDYSIELLLFGIFVHDKVLAERNAPLDDEARRGLRVSARSIANRLLTDTQRAELPPDAWDQLVDRRFADYAGDVRQAELDPANRERHLTKMCGSVVRYAGKSHVPNAGATKVLLQFYPLETAQARAMLTKYEIASDP